ncbi:MAG: hypothetical protein IJJ26_12605, partial [Victivallales bacterium]|nr:hypothetical protein [Victivallales bacterium]
DGAEAWKTTVNVGGLVDVASGGTASILFNPWQGEVNSNTGATVLFLEREKSVYYGGTESGTIGKWNETSGLQVTDGNNLLVYEDGLAEKTEVQSGGRLILEQGGMAYGGTAREGAEVQVQSGGVLSGMALEGTGTLQEGGSATGVTLQSGGTLFVSSAAIANNAQALDGGAVVVLDGGLATGTTVSAGGYAAAESGGTLSGTLLESGAVSGGRVASGGTALRTTVQESATLQVEGVASQTTLFGGGVIVISSGATATRTNLLENAALEILEGGTHLGELAIAEGAIAHSEQGGIVDFALQDMFYSDVIVTNLDFLSGTPTYQLSVAEDNGTATYLLASGAMDFAGTILVLSPTEKLLTGISLDCEDTFENYSYSLFLDEDGKLFFSIVDSENPVDTCPPVTPIIEMTDIQKESQSVLIQGKFSADSVIREYAIDEGDWLPYTQEGLVITEPCVVRMRATDTEGNCSDIAEYRVENLDFIPPEAPVAIPSTTGPTNQDVTVGATFSEDSVVRQYSLDGRRWYDYAEPIRFTDNGAIQFRAEDAAGNASVSKYTVKNIDRVPPAAPKASPSTTKRTNKDVIVAATYAYGTTVKEYSLDGTEWLPYEGGISMHENGTVYFRGTDAAGNCSPVTQYEVSNIDREAPAAPVVTASETQPTNTSLYLYPVYGEGTSVKQYSLDGENWLKYNGQYVKITQNTLVYFRGGDSIGNFSDIVTYLVDNIDKTAPGAPVAELVASEGTEKRIIGATFAEDCVKRQYKSAAVQHGKPTRNP